MKQTALILLLSCLICANSFAQQEGTIAIRPSPEYALSKEDMSGGAITRKHDGSASPGEILYLDIVVQNTGEESVRGLRAVLSSDDSRINRDIFLEKYETDIGDLAAGASASLTAKGSISNIPARQLLLQTNGLNRAFRFRLEKECSIAPILFTISFRDSMGKEWIETLSIPVNRGGDREQLPSFLRWIPFSLNTKIMEDGSVIDGVLGWNYTGTFSGATRVRWTRTEKNEEFESVEDSLNAVNQQILEFFLLPLEYSPVRKSSARLSLGIGGYYYDETLKEKGFFNMPELEYLGMERVNSYTNNFSLRVLGPVLDAGFIFRGSGWFKGSLSGGVVPVFATWAKQDVTIVPLLDPDRADYSQSHSGSPYLYGELSGMISLPDVKALARKQGAAPSNWKLWFSLLYDYSRLQYEILDFEFDGSGFNWYTPEREVVTQSFKIEGALLIPVGGMHLQVGVGRIFDSMVVDSGSAIRNGKNYLNISGKVIPF